MILHPIPYKEGILWVDKEKSVNKGLRWWVNGEDGIGRISNDLSYLYYGNPVLAQSPNLSFPNIPYIEIEEDADEIADKFLENVFNCKRDLFQAKEWRWFKKIYWAASAKKYTEEDLFKAIGVAIGLFSPKYACFEQGWKETVLKSLQPKPVSVEIEINKNCCEQMWQCCECTNGPIVNLLSYIKDGKTFLKVKKINYEY